MAYNRCSLACALRASSFVGTNYPSSKLPVVRLHIDLATYCYTNTKSLVRFQGFKLRRSGRFQGFYWGLPNLQNGTHAWMDTPELLKP
eukprot:4061582-Pleurochrysis_carterae.AAC.1